MVTGQPDSVRVNVDYVALADGTSMGEDTTDSAKETQRLIAVQHQFLQYLLNRVKREGPSTAKTILREELNAKKAALRHHR